MTGPVPYWADDTVSLYLGDCREVLPALGLVADLAVIDPPYQETSLAWDRWPDGWPAVLAGATRQMWCFGSMRMFLDRRSEFAGWRLAQDVIWQKHTGTGFAADRFRRVHEHALHWYRGGWNDLYRLPQREPRTGPAVNGPVRRSANRVAHAGALGRSTWIDDGTRLIQSVISAKNMKGRALHPCEKPAEVLRPLIAYSCPPGGLVLDPFAGSGSTLAVARELGMHAIGIEADPEYAEVIVRRLGQGVLA